MDEADELIAEQARRLARLCDAHDVGVVRPVQLTALDGILPKEALQQLRHQVGANVTPTGQLVVLIQRVLIEQTTELASKARRDSQLGMHDVQLWAENPLAAHVTTVAIEPNGGGRQHNGSSPMTLADDLRLSRLAEEEESSNGNSSSNGNNNNNNDQYQRPRNGDATSNHSKPSLAGSHPYRPSTLPEALRDPTSRTVLHSRKESEVASPQNGGELKAPDRIFKLVLVGDSGVGKTSFLHRYCYDKFKPLFNATIGVDFTVKTILVDDRLVAVQLWDTAGQERFRAITKQYFRKSDGVVLMFDISAEQSFLHVRNWIESVRAATDERTVLCLVATKIDLLGSDLERRRISSEAQLLAKEHNMLFFETSSYTGHGITACMTAVARCLQQREDEHLERALQLEMSVDGSPTGRRSWCCV